MKVDLEDLEHKAALATQGLWKSGLWKSTTGIGPHYVRAVVTTQSGDSVADVDADRPDEERFANVRHIAANSPPVTLALIARIRELEAGLDELLDCSLEGYGGREAIIPGTLQARTLDLIKKGVVLP